jgi:hypothetical protein
MSGGYFEYNQYRLHDMAEELKDLIYKIENKDEYYDDYNSETLKKFKECYNHLLITEKEIHRIDWLVSGDDGIDSYHERLKEELEEIETQLYEIED